MANWDYEVSNNPNILNKMVNIDKEWCSCLARNPCKKKYFMLDLDDKREYQNLYDVFQYHTKDSAIEHEIETQNGYHFLFDPCDTRSLMLAIETLEIDCELKRDDLLCIGYPEVNK